MERDQQASAPQAGLAGTASSFVPTATDARACLVDLRAREHAVVHEQFEMLVEEKRRMALNGEVVTAQYCDHRGVYLVTLTYTFGEAGAPHGEAGDPQGAAARPAGRNRDAPRDRPLLAKAAAPDCKGAGARSSPSAGISGRRLNNWKKKHCADGTLRPGAGMRVAARTAKRRAGLPARLAASDAPRPAALELVAAAPKASSSAPDQPALHIMPCEGTAVATAPDSSAGIRVQDKDSVMEVDDVPKFAATCSVKTYQRSVNVLRR
mmetsp:Transcript_37405/g.86411  ORF Transcript_37405/g.86411 Transcript_37405/m.86411 type:complete len:265 (+) Transcript_37405:54-848(+)